MLLNIVSKWPLHSQRIRGGCLVWSNFTISTNGLRIPAISVSQIVGMAAFVPPTLECVVCRISLALNLCVCVCLVYSESGEKECERRREG